MSTQTIVDKTKETVRWLNSEPAEKWAKKFEQRVNTKIAAQSAAVLSPPIQQVKEDIAKLKKLWIGVELAKNTRRTNLTLLGLILACVFYINILHPLVVGTAKSVVAPVQTVIEKTQQFGDWLVGNPPTSGEKTKFSGKFNQTPAPGTTIAGYQVTSPFGPRSSPCPGCSSMHMGVDIGMPMYTPLYAIGLVGKTVNVRCWSNGKWGWVASYAIPEWEVSFDYVHLPEGVCKEGVQKAGTVIAKSGTAGTGPHLHFQQRNKRGNKIAPQTGYIYWALTGKKP